MARQKRPNMARSTARIRQWLDGEVRPTRRLFGDGRELSGKRDGASAGRFGAKEWLFAAALLAAVALAYQPAWHGPGSGQRPDITRSDLRSWQGLYRIWFDVGATLQYYPVLHTAFWIEHALWGDAPLGYHLVNIFLHAAAAVLVALVLRQLKIPGAFLAAAIFALHPVYVESVAWMTEQKNTLSGVFYSSALLVYLKFDVTRRAGPYLVALGIFALAVLSKTVTATLPRTCWLSFGGSEAGCRGRETSCRCSRSSGLERPAV